MILSIRSRQFALPLITILVFAVSLLLGFGKLLQESRDSRGDIKELLYWSASQTVVEYWRFRGSLDRYAVEPSAERLDQTLLRLDLLWSRLNVHKGGEVGAQLQDVEGSEGTVAALEESLREIEPQLRTLESDGASSIAAIRARLAPHAYPLQLMAQRINLSEQGRAADFRVETARTYWLLLVLLVGVVSSGTLLIVLLFRETKSTAKLLAEAETAEASAQDVADRLSAVLDSSGVGIITIDAAGIITSFNPAAEQLFGYSADYAISRNASLLMPERDIPAHDRALANHPSPAATKVIGKTREVLARRSDSTKFPVEISVGTMTLGDTVNFVGFVVDISERKQAENALKASEQRFRDIAEIAGDWIWETDRENRYTYFSGQMEKVTGLDPKALLGKTRRELPWAGGDDSKWQTLHESMSAHQPFRDFSFEIHGPNIETRHVRISGNPIFDAEGAFAGYRGTGTDVTAQIAAEQEVAQKTNLLHATFDNIVEGIIVVDAESRVAAFNSHYTELFDVPSGTLVIGMPYEQFVRYLAGRGEYGPGDTADLVEHRMTRNQLDRARIDEHVRPNGTVLERRSNPLPGGGFVTTYADITDRRRIEDESRQSQKMEAIGRLTSGVAHEFNNLLTAIGGFAHLLKRQADNPEIVLEWSDDIIGAADQAATLTSQLLSFSRKQIIDPKVISIAKVFEETQVLIRPLMEGSIETDVSIPDEEVRVRADPGQIAQALLNLAINAQDAMPDGGRLSIASRFADLHETDVVGFEQADPGRYVAISVSDTGTGIDEETLGQVFEPFFSTKEIGEGTGLGLAMVYGMVQQTGGVITVESVVGKGATFTIYLPYVDEAMNQAQAVAEGENAPTGNETVLLVEDEAAVRQLASITLESLGYTVLTANDGMKAVEIFQDNMSAIDLLLTGLSVPGLDGRTLAQMLTSEVPNLRVLFITGHDETSSETPSGPTEIGSLIRKPFNPDDLGRAVRGALDSRNQSSAA